ncbi:PREDICTED: uncharacterized protein C8orf48 homolog [Nanorana parkeri]|uniref:uncharacterized protein C8orf48 homolog n=1 Tax=Nanorana parkeri TaxID=125878 RepID=UPI0008549AC0|nr:PREDICTED: uncharacterized protein C8orf48 homolog [Nanorana parkeri]
MRSSDFRPGGEQRRKMQWITSIETGAPEIISLLSNPPHLLLTFKGRSPQIKTAEGLHTGPRDKPGHVCEHPYSGSTQNALPNCIPSTLSPHTLRTPGSSVLRQDFYSFPLLDCCLLSGEDHPTQKLDIICFWPSTRQGNLPCHRAPMDQPPFSQGSPDYEASLAQSISGSSAANYSNDSFESSTDEPIWNYESDSFESDEPDPSYESATFESFSQVNSHEVSFSETTSITSEAVEVSDRNDTENDFIEKWITKLAKRKLQSANSSRPQLSSVAQPNYAETENSSLMSYCSMKIRHLHQQPTITQEKKQHPGQQDRSPAERHPSCCIPSMIINRLQMQSFKETMKQVIQSEMHDPSLCPDCIQKQAELAQSHFVRMRKTKLQADLMNLKLEEYTYKNDLLTYIGEIHQSLPKPSDGCSAIWQRLYTSVKT